MEVGVSSAGAAKTMFIDRDYYTHAYSGSHSWLDKWILKGKL